MQNQHLGSSFDDFLEEEGILVHCTNVAESRVRDYQSLNATQSDDFMPTPTKLAIAIRQILIKEV